MNRYEGWREHADRKMSFSPVRRERQHLFAAEDTQGHGGNDFFIILCSVAFPCVPLWFPCGLCGSLLACEASGAMILFCPESGKKFPGGSLFGFAEFCVRARKLLRILELMPNSLDSLQGSLPPEIFCKFLAENNDFSIYSKYAPAIVPVF